MGQAVVMPKFGQTVEEAGVVRWLKKEGDKVAKGDILLEIETDKAQLEVESFFEGTLLKIYVGPGESVPVQSTIAYIGEPGETPPSVEKPKPAAAAPKPAAAPKAAASAAAAPAPVAAAVAPVPSAPRRFAISPRAKKLAKDSVIDPRNVAGTGPGGRVVERDVKAYLEAHGYDKLKITPAAKKLAAKEGIDILTLRRDGGRIEVEAVERAVAEKPRPMSRIRQVIARRLQESFNTAPHFFVTVAVDMTDLIKLREKLKKAKKNFTVNAFILKAVALALAEHPEVNSVTDGINVTTRSSVHLGVAAATDQGLVVPVIRDAQDKSLQQISDEARELAGKARNGKLAPDEMQGSTFTVSNMGMLDVENFTAIINPGESAILAVSTTRETPVVQKGRVVVRQIMKMTISSDHRQVDGAVAAVFINKVRSKLEDIQAWKRMTS